MARPRSVTATRNATGQLKWLFFVGLVFVRCLPSISCYAFIFTIESALRARGLAMTQEAEPSRPLFKGWKPIVLNAGQAKPWIETNPAAKPERNRTERDDTQLPDGEVVRYCVQSAKDDDGRT